MATCTFRDSTIIGDFRKPYFVAEVNTSHMGNTDTAKEMIKQASLAGCNCVKFQSWSAESLYSKTYYDANPIAKRIVKKFAFSKEQIYEMNECCIENNIAFSSTPYSKSEVDFLVDVCNVPYVKIASMDLNNYPFIEYIAQTGVPIVLATGMSDIDEIHKAVETIENTGNKNLCLLHCISIYPPEISTIHLNNILGLRDEFPRYPIGFSDHSLGIEMDIAAVAIGASLIEKHFTLDNKKIGMDNQIAIEPDLMTQMINNCLNVHNALGNNKRVVLDSELEQRKKMRRSIVASHDLKTGSIIKLSDLDVKRPGTGMPPKMMNLLVGKSVVRDINSDEMINESDLTMCADGGGEEIRTDMQYNLRPHSD